MKKYIPITLGVLIAVVLVGCSVLSGPPSSFEKSVYTIGTNVVQKTNQVAQSVISTTTNPATGFTISITNVTLVPQVVQATNVTFTPAPATSGVLATAGALGGPWGTIGAAIAALGLGVWGSLRQSALNGVSTKLTVSQAIAGNSTQAIQVARNLIGATANGSANLAKFDAWLMTHQQDAGVAQEIAGVVDKYVDPQDQALSGVASQILAPAKSLLTS